MAERDGPDRPPLGAFGIALGLIGTLALGNLLRWFLAGRIRLPWNFGDLLHAHSHLGYYAVLFPLAWLGWRRIGAAVPGARVVAVYALAVGVALFGFLRAGYGPEAIVGSAVVGAIWLLSAWAQRARLREPGDPLAAVLPGVILAEACIPPIAIFLRRDPVLAFEFVATFLALLLLAVVIPSALAARRLSAPWPALVVAALLGAASLGIWRALPARLGLAVYAGLVANAVLRRQLAGHLRVLWLVLAAGLLAMAVGAVPNNRAVVIGAIHFTILGPVLASLAVDWLGRPPPTWVWWIGHGCVGALTAPLVVQGLGVGAWTYLASACGGTAVLLWWTLVLVWQVLPSPRQ